MKANTYLGVRVQGQTAVIAITVPGWMTFIGASCTASVDPFNKHIQSVSISAEPGENALIAIKSVHKCSSKGGGIDDNLCLIPLKWENGKMVVDLDQHFVPHAQRLVQLTSSSDVLVTTNGQRFTTCTDEWSGVGNYLKEKRGKLIESGCRIVEDPNLLLRFAIDRATFEDLEAAATLDKRSQTERQLAQCHQELEEKTTELTSIRKTLSSACEAVDQVKKNLSKADAEKALLIQERLAVQHIIGNSHGSHTRFGFLPWVKVAKLERLVGILEETN